MNSFSGKFMKNYMLFSFVFILASCQFNEVETKTLTKENSSQNYSKKINSNDLDEQPKIENGTYYSYKICNQLTKKCQIQEPYYVNGNYYLAKNNNKYKSPEFFITINDSKARIYYLDFINEYNKAHAWWSEMQAVSNKKNTYIVNQMNQVMGENPYTNNINFDILKSQPEITGKLKIGDSPQGNKSTQNQIISFINNGKDWTIDCNVFNESLKDLNSNKLLQFQSYFDYGCDSNYYKVYFKKL